MFINEQYLFNSPLNYDYMVAMEEIYFTFCRMSDSDTLFVLMVGA